jgi:pimeloyl-ACP methyl ester carboxylesterase
METRRRIDSLRRRLPFGSDRFRLGLEDRTAPLSSDFGGESTTLLLAFGGLAGKLGIPPFEFFSLTGEMPIKRLFVRDLHQAWYHRGIPGQGRTIPVVAKSLGRLIDGHEVERLVVVGVSAGGYAALAFGHLLGADAVVAFGAQTTIDLAGLAAIGDDRWDEQIGPLARASALDPAWTDLCRALADRPDSPPVSRLYFDADFGPDRRHAERLADLPGVSLHGIEGGAHEVARTMRQDGSLQRVLLEALQVGDDGG